ncbi:hypothetical protein CWB41_02740 [Methylovirgula ligni]|uniref:ThuA-like domain-containing protein n=1 Tax=Methylovirgula ligni TaxID=569860 RepID=A0A3D9YZQ0_9HYPH|nr:hypothetical protein [Methylovirgula ligni]QAY94790.1 hypothetical protein CWB41_02740 [Methylovirgula ligni]REF87308.1 hypothetical protein DES32_0928 [Methylovirgula ligni]
MAQLLYLSSGAQETIEKIQCWSTPDAPITIGNIYSDLFKSLDAYDAILIGMHADQRRLAAHTGELAAYLERGGTIVANGHVAYPYLPQIAPFQPIPDYRRDDLIVYRDSLHPVWDGVATEDLSQRRGVAGFYARGWHAPPPSAQVIHSIGDARRPVDFMYRVGSGRVLFHGGNELWAFDDGTSTAGRLAPQLFAWLSAGKRNS